VGPDAAIAALREIVGREHPEVLEADLAAFEGGLAFGRAGAATAAPRTAPAAVG